MKSMDKNELMDQLAQHGYALMRPKSRLDFNRRIPIRIMND